MKLTLNQTLIAIFSLCLVGVAFPASAWPRSSGDLIWGQGEPSEQLGKRGDSFFGTSEENCSTAAFEKVTSEVWQHRATFLNYDPGCILNPDPGNGNGDGEAGCPLCDACITEGAQDSYLFRATSKLDQVIGTLDLSTEVHKTAIGQERIVNFPKDSGGSLKTTQATTSDLSPVFFDTCSAWSGHNWRAASPAKINFILEGLTVELVGGSSLSVIVKIKRRASGSSTADDLATDSIFLPPPGSGVTSRIRTFHYLETGPVEFQDADEVFVVVEAQGGATGSGVLNVLSGPRCLQDESIVSRHACTESNFTWIPAAVFYNQDSEF